MFNFNNFARIATAMFVSFAAPAAMAQNITTVDAELIADTIDARAAANAAPHFNVFRGHTAEPESLTAEEIVTTYTGQTIFVQPHTNGAVFKSCSQFEEYGKTVFWNTGGAANQRRICPGDGISYDPDFGFRTSYTGGRLDGYFYENGTGRVAVRVPNVALTAPTGFMSLFIES